MVRVGCVCAVWYGVVRVVRVRTYEVFPELQSSSIAGAGEEQHLATVLVPKKFGQIFLVDLVVVRDARVTYYQHALVPVEAALVLHDVGLEPSDARATFLAFRRQPHLVDVIYVNDRWLQLFRYFEDHVNQLGDLGFGPQLSLHISGRQIKPSGSRLGSDGLG